MNEPKLPANVANLIPHGTSIRVVDQLIHIGDEMAITEMTVRKDCPLVDETGQLDELAFVEMMAQSFAARHRFDLTDEERKSERGFLLGVKNLTITGEAHVGDRLTIEIQKVARFGDFGVVEGHVRHDDGKLLATGQLKIWRSTDPELGKEQK